MSATATLLTKEQAVAARLLRQGFAAPSIWAYLAGRVESPSIGADFHHPSLNAYLARLIAELGSNSTADARRAIDCAAGISMIMNFVHQSATSSSCSTLKQLNASCLLPLYRTTAGDAIDRLVVESGRVAASGLALAGLTQTLGTEFSEAVDSAASRGQSPFEYCQKSLGLDVTELAQRLVVAGYQWDGQSEGSLFQLLTLPLEKTSRPSWAAPTTLWKLAGEVASDHSEFILPRDWISIPIVWHEVADHYREWQRILDTQSDTLHPKGNLPKPNTKPNSTSPSTSGVSGQYSVQHAASRENAPSALNNVLNSLLNSSASLDPTQPSAASQPNIAPTSSDGNPPSHWLRGDSANLDIPTSGNSPESSKHQPADSDSRKSGSTETALREIESEIHENVTGMLQELDVSKQNANRLARGGSQPDDFGMFGKVDASDDSQDSAVPNELQNEEVDIDWDPSSHPKLPIAEVRSQNDPAFMGVIRRQLALGRHEASTVTLCAIRVSAESDDDNQAIAALQSNGLSAWQQRFVNLLVESPQVHNPFAFICDNGELILCLLDIERNEATKMIREVIVEVLTGKKVNGASSIDLTRNPIPASYFAGIASVSSPSASFTAEQLVLATYRCLTAVESQGKSAIKSIEAF